jgi:hypothetical protein
VIVLRCAPDAPADLLKHLRIIALRHPGPHGLVVLTADRRVELGPAWSFSASPTCLAALGEFGTVEEPEC